MKNKTKQELYHWTIFTIVAGLFTIIVYSQASMYFTEQEEMAYDSGLPVRNFWDN